MHKQLPQNFKAHDKTQKTQLPQKKSHSRPSKLKNLFPEPQDPPEAHLILTKKQPIEKKSSIDLQNSHSKNRKKSKKKICIQTLLPHQLNSDLEKSFKKIDKDRAKSNLEISLKARLELSQKVTLHKNISPQRVDLLIKNSLQKEKQNKVLREKEIKQKKLEEEIRKLESDYQNNLIRKINAKKYKLKKHKPCNKNRGEFERSRLSSSRIKTGRLVSSRRTIKELKTVRSISAEKHKPNKYFAEDLDIKSNREKHKQDIKSQDLYQSKTEKGVKRNISMIDNENNLNGRVGRKKIIEKSDQIDYSKYFKPDLLENKPENNEKKSQEFQKKRAARIIQKAYRLFKHKKQLKKNTELLSLIHEQISWTEAQLLSFEYLKAKELEDLQSISELFLQNTDLEEHLLRKVKERYDNFTELFKENLKNTEKEVARKMNTAEHLDFSGQIKDKKQAITKLIEDSKVSSCLNKGEVENLIKESKETQLSISCQTSIDLNPEPDHLSILKEVNKQIQTISLNEILLLDSTIFSPISQPCQKFSLPADSGESEEEVYENERPSTSPIPARPHAPLMFLDTDDISLESLLNTSTPVNSKNSLGLPLLNLNNIQSGVPSIQISSDPRIETSPKFIFNFLTEVFQKINKGTLKSELSAGLEKKPLDELKKIRESDFGVIEKELLKPVINVKQIIDNVFAEGSEDVLSTQRFVSKADRIHKIMILQAADEVLQSFRPYGKLGAPNIWSERSRKIGKFEVNVEEVLKKTAGILEEFSGYQIGKIPCEEMILTNGRVDEEVLQDIREDALGYSMKQEILEFEWVWTDYEFEVAQVKLDLAEMILFDLCEETVKICN